MRTRHPEPQRRRRISTRSLPGSWSVAALAPAGLALLLLLACRGEQAVPPPPGPPQAPIIKPPPSDAAERSSVVNLGYGSTVVSRTGELVLETSALGAVDGDPGTDWSTPLKDVPQSVVVALAARARIDGVGIRTQYQGLQAAKEVVFEASDDGRSFRPLGRLVVQEIDRPQWIDVAPTDVAFLRLTIPSLSQHDNAVRIASFLARGRELEPPHPGPIAGCWRVNGRTAAFRSQGTHVAGLVTYAHSTMMLVGGNNGRVSLLEWVDGADFGYAVLAVSPDGRHLSGTQWHEEPIPRFFGDAWFGEAAAGDCHEVWPSDPDAVAHAMLARAGRHSLFALRFGSDGALDARASEDELASLTRLLREHPSARLVAHEFREATAEANRARAQRTLDSLRRELQNARIDLGRVTFVAAGSDQPRQIPGSEAARELYSSVDLEVRR